MTRFEIRTKIPLSNSTLTNLLQNPYQSNELISTSFNGQVSIWKLPNLQQETKINLNLTKLTAIVPFHNSQMRGFLVAAKNGELVMLSSNFQIFTIIKIHHESISQIIVSTKYVITIGMDGKVMFLCKERLEKEKEMEFEYPLFSGVEFENKIYLSSLKSFVIDMESYEWREGKRFDRFFVLQDNLYGCSDERGLSSVVSNSNNYIPAEFLLAYNRKMVIFSEKSIGVSNMIKKIEYKAQKYEEFSWGESITTGVVVGDSIYVGGNEGNLYWIGEIREEKQKEDEQEKEQEKEKEKEQEKEQ